MQLPYCANCDHPFKWKEIFFSPLKFRTPNCSRCGSRMHETASSLNKTSFIMFLPVFGLMVMNFFERSLVTEVIASVILFVIAIALRPFWVRYSIKKTALF